MGRLAGQRAYLSGPMDRVADRGRGWREWIIPILQKRGVGILNPLDKPQLYNNFEGDEEFIKLRNHLRNEKRYDELALLIKEHVTQPDLEMIDDCTFEIIYVDVNIHLAGTYHELILGVQQRKPTLIMCEQRKDNVPFWWWGIVDHNYFFSSWGSLIDYLDYVDNSTEKLKRWRFFDYKKVFNENG
jgi:hypothetical protein